MIVLVLNCGSSSMKYLVFNVDSGEALAKGIAARIGEDGSYVRNETRAGETLTNVPLPTHHDAFDKIAEGLLGGQHAVLGDLSEVSAVGHRVVHGGERFRDSVLITAEVVKAIEELCVLAPLHNPANLEGIREAERTFPTVPHVAVFDTTFHRDLLPEAYLYAIPYAYYEQHQIRRYAFHGTSFRFVVHETETLIGLPCQKLKMVICHLGSGVTIAAVKDGKAVDASTGFTPLEGPMMGTRSGDLDPGIVLFMGRQLNMTLDQIDTLLNRESGLLGVSGVSNDLREVARAADAGNARSQLSISMFNRRVKKYVGAYAAVLGGLDALVFTGGVGENSPSVRTAICDGLGFLGVALDGKENETASGCAKLISTTESTVRVLVVPTDEEKLIALDTAAILLQHTVNGVK